MKIVHTFMKIILISFILEAMVNLQEKWSRIAWGQVPRHTHRDSDS